MAAHSVQQTAALSCEKPILWLPVLFADMSAFCLTRLQKLLMRQLIDSLLLSRSVLTGRVLPPVGQRALILKAALLSAPFVWGTYFLK
jgi:hypothetical protein